MEFAEWLEAQGFDSNELTETQATSLEAMFAAQGNRTDAAAGAVGTDIGTPETDNTGTATGVIETYGTLLSLNRQMMINDDLGAFLRLPRIIGRQSAIKLQKVGFSLLLTNGGSFFGAGNNNYFEGADTNLQITSLTTAEQMFFDQKDDNGDPVSITPGMLLLPTSLKTIAGQLYNDVAVNETTTTNKPKPASNPHAGKFRPVATPWLNAQSLTGSSSTAWYLLGDPADAAVIEVIYLRGRRRPVIEREESSFNTLGMQWRGYFDFGVAMQEKRAGVKAKGAA